MSYDASYRATNAHDLLVSLAENTTVDGDALRAAVDAAPHPEWVADLTTSLAVSVQVDASTADETILVPGRMVGIETDREPTPPIDTLSVAGRPRAWAGGQRSRCRGAGRGLRRRT